MQIDKTKTFDRLIHKLDLTSHINELKSFFSREQSLFIEGDQQRHFNFINELQTVEFKVPPKIKDFSIFIIHLKKHGILNFNQIFEIVKLIRYIKYFKNLKTDKMIKKWIDSIAVPVNFLDIDMFFDEKGNFNEHLDERLHNLNKNIKKHKNNINSILKKVLHSSKLSPYLADLQVHFINDEECLLLRGGFNHVIKGSIMGRSTAGYFYISPNTIIKEKQIIKMINQEREASLYEYTKQFSLALFDMTLFLNYINKEFNRFDHYQARICFAKSKDFVILHASKHSNVIIYDFKHPALHNPKSVSVNFTKNILMITGVNAGGKTMLLKSLLSSILMAKYLIPMSINETKSSIGSFKNLNIIIDDSQNVKNDISTFAGRMQDFSKIFDCKSVLTGVDEIELGTDSDEAAALFTVILDELIKKGQKVIITTHHKRLASLMADRQDVELLAALYDEVKRLPTYQFLQGIIGKSYAFETASRYHIPSYIIKKAKIVYGLNHEKLNELIQRSSTLERELKDKHKKVDEKLQRLQQKEQDLKEFENSLYTQLKQEKSKLKTQFDEAMQEVKNAIKSTDIKSKHRAMSKANKIIPKDNYEPNKKIYEFKAGDIVKYRDKKGQIILVKDKEALVEIENLKMHVKIYELKPSQQNFIPKQKSHIYLDIQRRSGLKCDLHGLRADEAVEVLDKFLSDALIAGWDEVIVYHGIGTGKLSWVVKDYLKSHPKVKKFEDAPQHLGGFGAKVIYL